MSSAIGIEKKAVTLTMGANEDAQVAEALSRVLGVHALPVGHFQLRARHEVRGSIPLGTLTWTLKLPDALKSRFKNEEITDISFGDQLSRTLGARVSSNTVHHSC